MKRSPVGLYKDYKDLHFLFSWFALNIKNGTNPLKSNHITDNMMLLINTTRFWSLSTQVLLALWIFCQDGTESCNTGKTLRL